MDAKVFLDAEIAEHLEVAARTRAAVAESFARLVEAGINCLGNGGKILFFGNGGSAADAQHLAAELLVRYRFNRRALAAIALTTDTSTLTACANDFSYEEVFSRQVEALCRPGDLAIGISTSGNSANVNRALEAAKAQGGIAAGLCGRDGGAMRDICDPLVVVPSAVTGRIQEMHILLGHAFCDLLERAAADPAA